MLKCRDIAHQASAYLDHNLTLRQRIAVGMHLLICGKCREFIRHMRASLAYYRQLPTQDIDDKEADIIADRAAGKPLGPTQ